MKRSTPLLMLALAALWIGAGCGTTTTRKADVMHWHDAETVYLVYEETTQTFPPNPDEDGTLTRVKMCKVQPDNALQCVEQGGANELLNPQTDRFVGQNKPASNEPAPSDPVEPTEPAESVEPVEPAEPADGAPGEGTSPDGATAPDGAAPEAPPAAEGEDTT